LSDGATADATTYDDFGRPVSYTENTSSATGQTNVANTSYDSSTGRVTSTRDQHQRVTYGYNSSTEHRGLPTSRTVDVTTTNDSGATLWTGSFTATYDSNGQILSQIDANAVTSTLSRDETGQLLRRTDLKNGTEWLADAMNPSIHGQSLAHNGPAGTQTYVYDAVGRLISSKDAPTLAPCTTRRYIYDRNSNRLGSTSTSAGDQECAPGTIATVTASYDTADRLLAVGMAYDSFGRTTTAPAAAVSGGGDVSVGYYVNDLVASQTQTDPQSHVTTTDTWALDQTQRRFRGFSSTVGGASQPFKMSHYDDASADSPNWISETEDGSAWTANILDLVGALAGSVTQSGVATFQYVNLHGDVQAACLAGATAPTIGGAADEFGKAQQPARYAWLGGEQRSGDALGGLIVMGLRLYAPAIGRFLQRDSVDGGSANAYDYANQDPVGQVDLDGRSSCGHDTSWSDLYVERKVSGWKDARGAVGYLHNVALAVTMGLMALPFSKIIAATATLAQALVGYGTSDYQYKVWAFSSLQCRCHNGRTQFRVKGLIMIEDRHKSSWFWGAYSHEVTGLALLFTFKSSPTQLL
jgi:RHS repeat-associated protein